jgi:DNA-directed RNA polymerase specialized sigma subunit
MARKPKPENDYVDRKKLKEELDKSFAQDELTDEAWRMFMLMGRRISYGKYSYKYEDDREDCIMVAMEAIQKYWLNYDETKSKYPFSYFTTVIMNGIAKGFREIRPKSVSEYINMTNEQMANL